MKVKKIWTKLFTPKTDEEAIALHLAGATVRHNNPFEQLEVPYSEEAFSAEFVAKWIEPFYMSSLSVVDDAEIQSFASAAAAIGRTIVERLLICYNWRTRITGAYFAAINNYGELEDIIGRQLLKSELCYAGVGYSIALAAFGTDSSKHYLQAYLDYYLTRNDLWYDQAEAFCALEYLDKEAARGFLGKWNSFTADKENWNLDRSRESFASSMKTINKIRELRDKEVSF